MAFLLNPYVFSSLYTFTVFAIASDTDQDNITAVTATLNTNGSVTVTGSDISDDLDYNFVQWHNDIVAGIGNSRWAKKTLLNGSDITSGTLGTSITSLSSPRTISIEMVGAETRQGEVLIEIYSDSGGTNKVGEIYLTLTAFDAAA